MEISSVPSKIEFFTRWINPYSVSTLVYRILSGPPRTGRPSIHWALYLLSISYLDTLVEFRERWNVMYLIFVAAVFDVHCSKTSIRFLEIFRTISRGNNYTKIVGRKQCVSNDDCFGFYVLSVSMVSSWFVERMLDHSRHEYSYLAIFFYAINSSTWFTFLHVYFSLENVSFTPFLEAEIIHRLSKRMRN